MKYVILIHSNPQPWGEISDRRIFSGCPCWRRNTAPVQALCRAPRRRELERQSMSTVNKQASSARSPVDRSTLPSSERKAQP